MMRLEYIWLFFGVVAISLFIYAIAFLELGISSQVAYPVKEAELYTQRIASGAYQFFKNRVVKHGLSNSFFPCSKQGWICSPNYLACQRGSIYYDSAQSHWAHNCWKALGFQITGKHLMQYCYKASGKGKGAKFIIQATGTSSCNVKQTKITIHFDRNGSNGLIME